MTWKLVEIIVVEQNEERRMKRTEKSLRDLRDNIKCTDICIKGSQKEKRERKGLRISEEIIAENFPNMGKEILKLRKHRDPNIG